MTPSRNFFNHPLAAGLLAVGLAGLTPVADANSLDEAVVGDFSNDGLVPTLFLLDAAPGNNVLSGRVGRVAGVVDRDYVHVVVPTGYFWTGLIVGDSTLGGGGGSAFIGLGSGASTSVLPTTSTAAGLLGFALYGEGDRGNDILDDMAISGQGSSGFTTPLSAGSYTLWIQELATGDYPYSFNLTVSAVPEPTSALLMWAGLGVAGAMALRGRRAGAVSRLSEAVA
ncbi:MAG: PEP-CTERM sorting domain-containing protein [Chitinophagaceae bacterium]|nr:PEP-CTERM sorting domain-containing protein [Rubrivivax sp.]